MSEAQDDNSRKHTRLPIRITATVSLADGNDYTGATRNMSFGGAFINIEAFSAGNVEDGSACELKLSLGSPDEPVIVPIKGKLARSNEEGVAVEFEHTTIEGYWHFKNIMIYNSPEVDMLLDELEKHPGLSVGQHAP